MNQEQDPYEIKLKLLLDWMDVVNMHTRKETNRRYKKLAEFTGYDAKGLYEDDGWCYDVLKGLAEDEELEAIQKLVSA